MLSISSCFELLEPSNVHKLNVHVFCHTQSFNPVTEPSDDWECKFGTSPEKTYKEIDLEGETLADENKDFSFPCGPSLSEDDDELTESKIKAFLDEKVEISFFLRWS